MNSHTVRLAATLAGLVLLCTACQTNNDPTDPVSPTPVSSGVPSATAQSSASPTPTAEETAEEAAIRKARPLVDDYMRVTDLSIQDPENFNDKDLKKVAISSALTDAENELAMARGNMWRQIGNTEVVEVTVDNVDLRNRPKRQPPYIPTATFRVCYDVTDLQVVDEKGKSVVNPDRKDTGVVMVGVSNYEYPDGPWLVSYLDWKAGAKC